jgi:hypothetical protein
VAIRRHVQLSDEFVTIAEDQFPPDGTDPDGAPPWSVFKETPLRVAIEAFGRDFERYQLPNGIAVFSTSETVFIRKPIQFFARLVPETGDVELVDVEVDWDYIDPDELLGGESF